MKISVSGKNELIQSKKWGELHSIDGDNKIALEIYSDEIKRVKLESDKSLWMYIGALFVPVDVKGYYLDLLNKYRCVKNNDWVQEENLCPHRCGYHDKNNTEIHYKELHRSNARFKIAEKWIENIICRVPVGDNRKLYFNILGLNLSNMDLELFGENNHLDMVIYNRFYRTVLQSGFNYFFKNYKQITINKIYHDIGEQSSDKLFPWHPLKIVDIENDRISIKCKEIEFIDSDHRVSKKQESNFIQLLDLTLGATFCCLHNPSANQYKRRIGRAFKPVLMKLLDRRRAPNSSAWIGDYYKSKYYRTYQVSFFPREKTDLLSESTQFDIFGGPEDDQYETNVFYYDRPVILGSQVQKGLDGWPKS